MIIIYEYINNPALTNLLVSIISRFHDANKRKLASFTNKIKQILVILKLSFFQFLFFFYSLNLYLILLIYSNSAFLICKQNRDY
jgi:hypothetical protein